MSKEGKARVLTLSEFRRAERAAMLTRHPLRNRALLYLSFALALRACELRRLRIGDVLSPDGILLEELNLLKCMTKGSKQRHVYLTNDKARDALQEYLDYLIKKNKGHISYDDYLFASQKGGEFHPSNIVRVFRYIFRDSCLSNASSHSGRRTFITNRIDEGIDIRSIALLVGHDDINTTIGYHDANSTKLKKISSKSIF